MDAIKQEALSNLFRSASNLADFLKQLHSQPKQLQSSETQITRNNMATSGSLENVDPSLASSGSGELKLNLPKRKPTFAIETTCRNATCPCGSGKKFKQCCGKTT